MCMRPSIEPTLFSLGMPDEAGGGAAPIISGTISYKDTFQQANLGDWKMCSTFYRNGGSVKPARRRTSLHIPHQRNKISRPIPDDGSVPRWYGYGCHQIRQRVHPHAGVE